MVFQNGWSALHFAAKAGYLAVVKLLVETGASPLLETTDGKVAITFAAAANHSDVLSFLMKKDHSTQALMDDKKVSVLLCSVVFFLYAHVIVCYCHSRLVDERGKWRGTGWGC